MLRHKEKCENILDFSIDGHFVTCNLSVVMIERTVHYGHLGVPPSL